LGALGNCSEKMKPTQIQGQAYPGKDQHGLQRKRLDILG
jgi:hypothetical protein